MARRYIGSARRIEAVHRLLQGHDKPVVNMDPAVAKAAVDVAHAAGKPVFAHPQNMAGVETVIAAGVDIMAHTVAGEPGYSPSNSRASSSRASAPDSDAVAVCKAAAVGPDIAARLVATTVDQLKAFSDNGGRSCSAPTSASSRIYDTTLEYELMHRALSERQVLASLTTNPAQLFQGCEEGQGREGV